MSARYRGPLLTVDTLAAMKQARDAGATQWTGSLDLGRSTQDVCFAEAGWAFESQVYPWPESLKDRTIYYWDGQQFAPVAHFGGQLIKLVPTDWQVPTFEIDGIKMLPSAQVSPWDDARQKVELIAPRGRRVLDTCGGLGYFAAWCLQLGAAQVQSFEKNADVLWLRRLNPWSPDPHDPAHANRFQLTHGDVAQAISTLPDASFDAALHDPPRFGIAGELYSQAFYDQLARVLRPSAPLFHYTGSPNRLTSGRDVPGEVLKRLERAGFRCQRKLDGVLGVKQLPSSGKSTRRSDALLGSPKR